jgi:ATP-dependent Lon protease
MTVPSSIAVRELPLFPLPEIVLFPGRPLPLHIFEFRYRMMMNTILENDGYFGVVMWDPAVKTAASVGCCAEVIEHQRLPDDRMKIWTMGQKRFRVLDYVRKKPFYVGLVEWLEDEPINEDLSPLAADVTTVLNDVVRLSAKLMGQAIEMPDDLPESPTDLSYWVAGNLYGVADEQQSLLEMQSSRDRLEREVEILTTTRNHLAARTVIKDTFDNS